MYEHEIHEQTVRPAPRPAGVERPSAGPVHPGAGGERAVLGLQRSAGNASVTGMLAEQEVDGQESVRQATAAGGRGLEAGTLQLMGERLGHDFNGVRVHTGGAAEASAASFGATAYTTGSDIVFGSGSYAPGTDRGDHLLAHELTHVVQQSQGPVAGTPQSSGVSVSDPSDEFERAAETSADHAMAAGPVQREAEAPEEDEALQMSAQREAEAPEDEELQMSVQREAEAPEEEEEEEFQA